MNFLVAGSGGFIGTAAVRHFSRKAGCRVFGLVRNRGRVSEKTFFVDYGKGRLEIPDDLEFDCVLNLCGANLMEGRWTSARKAELLESRTVPASRLSRWIADGRIKTRVFLSASGLGYYGSGSDSTVDENAPKGKGFLSDVCRAWEEPVLKGEDGGARRIVLRIGAVLSPEGGMLKKLQLPFSLGLGGKLGNGKSRMGWIGMRDLLAACEFLVETSAIRGAVNLCTPCPVSNSEFTQALAKHFGRPAWFSVPAFALRLLLGEAADELALSDQKAFPQVLERAGFRFSAPTLGELLRQIREETERGTGNSN